MVVATGPPFDDVAGPDGGAVEADVEPSVVVAGVEVLDPAAAVDAGTAVVGVVAWREDDPHPETSATIATTPARTPHEGFVLIPIPPR
jgi:hypothetical protein